MGGKAASDGWNGAIRPYRLLGWADRSIIGLVTRATGTNLDGRDGVPAFEQTRQRLAGVALLVAVALGVGATPGVLGIAAYQLAVCGSVERVWMDLAREVAREVGGDRGGTGASSVRSASARQLQGALAKAVRDLLTGKSKQVIEGPLGCGEVLAATGSSNGVEGEWRRVSASRVRTYAAFAQPPPVVA